MASLSRSSSPLSSGGGGGGNATTPQPRRSSPLEDILYPPPTSVEEAGALLGASITRLEPTLLPSHLDAVQPPPGMHSSFATVRPAASSELYVRLASMRALLRERAGLGVGAGEEEAAGPGAADAGPVEPLQSAPSLLAVLMKLVGMTAGIASCGPVLVGAAPQVGVDAKKRQPTRGGGGGRGVPVCLTPPLLSTAVRAIWVDCVVLCYRLGDGLAAAVRPDAVAFLRRMMRVVVLNPRTQKAAGGTRVAALQTIAGLFSDPVLSRKVAPWAYDVLHLCHKALKSSGTNEPHYRALAVRAAVGVAVGCREAAIAAEAEAAARGSPGGKVGTFVIRGAWEDRATSEAVKLLYRAAEDRFPEVRAEAAAFGSAVAPLAVRTDRGDGTSSRASAEQSGPLSSLDDMMHIAAKNLDDESAGAAAAWAEALARCVCVAIESAERARAGADGNSMRRSGADDGDGPDPGAASASGKAEFAVKFRVFSDRSRSVAISSLSCTSLLSSVDFLVGRFIKVGGEFEASKCGGAYSSGGRGVRVGLASVIEELLKLQVAVDGASLAGTGSTSATEVLRSVLEMVGPAIEIQLLLPAAFVPPASGGIGSRTETLEVTSSPTLRMVDTSASGASSIFSQSKKARSVADSGVARLLTSRILRRLSEASSEGDQQTLLRDLAALCKNSFGVSGSDDGVVAAMCDSGGAMLNRYQLQIILIEISNLIAALGEAGAAALEDILPVLSVGLSHEDHGVRHETAVALQATARSFPREGRKMLASSLEAIAEEWNNIVANSMNQEENANENKETVSPKRRFGRSKGSPANLQPSKQMIQSLKHQYSVHGHSLAVSLLLHELGVASEGLSTIALDNIITIAHSLVKCQENEVLAKASPGAVCTCVRSGYSIISAVMTAGPQAVSSHIASIFRLWQNSGKLAEEGTPFFSTSHDVTCLDGVLVSVVSFLRTCSELLLSIPDALNRTTLLLEKVFPLLFTDGRLGSQPQNPAAAARLDSAKASVMEAFSWLPPGSYAFAADQIFVFAAIHIQNGTEDEVVCSILGSLVTSEDKILDSVSFARASCVGQAGGACNLEGNLVALSSDPAHHSERESVIHNLAWRKSNRKESFALDVFSSPILELVETEEDRSDPPTPLHAVGTWKQPSSSSAASQVRLLDAAIHLFAATFGMQNSRAQEKAVRSLEGLLPTNLLQSARSLNVASSLITENDRRPRDEIAAASNISATLLACLQAFPLNEASREDFITMGPPWMNRAKNLFLALLPSSVHLVRRSAAEGLSLLATLGVTEDARTLQSSILYSLDELMKGNLPDGSTRKFQLNNESLSSVKSGSLLTLACIQRTAQKIDDDERRRDKAKSSAPDCEKAKIDTAPQTTIMITRVLPSCGTSNMEGDFFGVRTHALHSLLILLAYSIPKTIEEPISSEDVQTIHTIRKCIEVIETNFLSAWTAPTADYDAGQEGEKFTSEPMFLAVLLRFMTLMLPWLHLLRESDCSVASRFVSMASTILENSSMHPTVIFEGFVFFARAARVKPSAMSVAFTMHPTALVTPFIWASFESTRPTAYHDNSRMRSYGVQSILCQRACVILLKYFAEIEGCLTKETISDSMLHGRLYQLLDLCCGSKYFQHASFYRTVSAPRHAERGALGGGALESEIVSALWVLHSLEVEAAAKGTFSGRLLHSILLWRTIVTGGASGGGDLAAGRTQLHVSEIIRSAEVAAEREASRTFIISVASRWQLKCQATNIAASSMRHIENGYHQSSEMKSRREYPHFNPSAALELCSQRCQDLSAAQNEKGIHMLPSFASLHMQSLIKAACGTATATSDQAELPSLQTASLLLLNDLVRSFGDALDPELSANGDGHQMAALQPFSSQIAASVRHALHSGDDGVMHEGLSQLYISGCNTLLTVISKHIITDTTLLKRFVRNISGSFSGLSFVTLSDVSNKISIFFPDDALPSPTDMNAYFLIRIWGLRTLAQLRLSCSLGLISGAAAASILEETCANGEELGGHAASLALDGARLLEARAFSLCGTSSEEEEKEYSAEFSPGLTFPNVHDIDESVKQALTSSWFNLANYAIHALISSIESRKTNTERRKQSIEWINALIPLLFAGVHDALGNLNEDMTPTKVCASSPEHVATACLEGLRALMIHNVDELTSFDGDIQSTLQSIRLKILLPNMGFSPPLSSAKTDISDKGSTLVAQACAFLSAACHARLVFLDLGGLPLLQSVLFPLVAIETGQCPCDKDDDGSIDTVISSCFECGKTLMEIPDKCIGGGIEKASLAKALLNVVLLVLSFSSDTLSLFTKSKEVALSLLSHIMADEWSIFNAEEKLGLASSIADRGSWEGWKVVCTAMKGGAGVSLSIASVAKAMGDFGDSKSQKSALFALQAVIKDVKDEHMIDVVMEGTGAEVVDILKSYGCCSVLQDDTFSDDRTQVVGAAMKILMSALQHMCLKTEANEAEHSLVSFLVVIFDLFLSLITYNGLPNHTSGKTKADSSIGRLSAQAIVYVARTVPAAFRASISHLPLEDRAALEAAVRADMNGYAQVKQAPERKKLSLKGFK